MAYDTTTTLALVKARLNRMATDTTLDDYLTKRIEAAAAELAHSGIVLDAAMPDDVMFCADYVVWQYQCRDATGGMPDWLRLRRRERWLQQRTDGGTA
ncbi:MAG: hypothetical protein VB104_02720 [Candidatus Limiplasma sp.]|nr:hypothetical protein [Candidatus Limiplasma sp.]